MVKANENSQGGNGGGSGKRIPGITGSASRANAPDAAHEDKPFSNYPHVGATATGKEKSPGKLPEDPQATEGDIGEGGD